MGQITFIMVGCEEIDPMWRDDSDFPDGIAEWIYGLDDYLEEPSPGRCMAFRTHKGRSIEGRFTTFKSTYEADPQIVGFLVRVLDKYCTYNLEGWDEVPRIQEEWARLQERAAAEGKTLPDCDSYIIVDHH